MKTSHFMYGFLFTFSLFGALATNAAPEAFEVGAGQVDQLPGGQEADGIIGDFIMRNDKIEAVISCNAVLRKANMGTNWGAITPGTLYDLTLRGTDNDQLTIFAPLHQEGPVSYTRIVSDGSDGKAVIETVISAPLNNGMYEKHEYILQDGWQGLHIVTTLRNENDEEISLKLSDRIYRHSVIKTINGITVADANDPAHKQAYAFAWVESHPIPGEEIDLAPGEEVKMARALSVGTSPANAYGLVARYTGPTGQVAATLKERGGEAISTGELIIEMGDETLKAYPDDQGKMNFRLPPGEYAMTARDHGRADQKLIVNISANDTEEIEIVMPDASAIAFDIRGDDDESLPCKAQFIGINETESPDLGPSTRAHGCLDQYHSETGEFTVQVPPGDYRVVVTRGIEYSHIAKEITLGEGETLEIEGTLTRMLDTSGWVSADFHNHSTPSGDNVTGTYDRVINLAAEHIEFAPTTEHNRIYDWTPYIKSLGLSEHIHTIPGIELTGSGTHFNAFPYDPAPRTQDGGAPVWQQDPRLNAIVLRDFQGAMPERWVQINHPDMTYNFIDRDGDGLADGGFMGLHELIDAAETWGPNTYDHNILTRSPFRVDELRDGRERVYYQRQFIWLQLLNQGHNYWSVAVSDAHTIHGNGVGGWRTYLPSSTDEPADIDWKELIRNAKAGQIVITNGPFLEVETLDGAISGAHVRAAGSLPVHVKVQCNDWIDIDRIQFLVNGRQREDLNFTRDSHGEWFKDGVVKFDQTIDVPLSEDSHVIVVAYGENFDLETGYGSSWQSGMNPCAYTNPIFVDIDGGGFKPNGDTLDFPLPVARISVEDAKAMLERLDS